MKTRFDFIVVGIGSMGSAATYFLAKQGHAVLGIDQFSPPHESGSHAGQSRIIRKAYFEHPDYVPLLQRSYDLWKEFEGETSKQFYYETGIVYFGDKAHPTMTGVRNSAEIYEVDVRVVEQKLANRDFPGFKIPTTFETLYEREAGFIRPELAITNYLNEAKRLSATLVTNEKVIDWSVGSEGVTVKTDRSVFYADKLILTAGSWMKNIVPSLHNKLQVTRQSLVWINPKNPERFSLGNFPCWFIEDPDLGMYYGFPVLPFEQFGGPIGLKIASHRPGEIIDPDHKDKSSSPVDDNSDHGVRPILSKYFDDVGDEIITSKTCLYTYSPDENFIIDLLPDAHSRVVIAAGFSGHGFKFVPVIGELLATLATEGKPSMDINFLKLNRFSDKPDS